MLLIVTVLVHSIVSSGSPYEYNDDDDGDHDDGDSILYDGIYVYEHCININTSITSNNIISTNYY